jgi:S-adenosylmethionine decarboxylase
LDSASRHWLVEYHGCDPAILNDRDRVRLLLREAAEAAGATVVAEVFHPYAPHGVTGVIVIEESHLSVHTWPEYGYAASDFFTCGDCRPELAHQVLSQGFAARRVERMVVGRGLRGAGASLSVQEHVREPSAD